MARIKRATIICIAVALATAACRDKTADSTSPSQPSSPPTIAALSIEGTAPAVGERAQFSATAILPNGTPRSVTAAATWQSSDIAIATVGSSGMVTAVGPGTVEISATYEGVRGVRTISVAARARVTVSGLVSDAAGGGILPNVTVAILDGVNQARAISTDANGAYSLSNLLAGTFTISASAGGYTTVSRQTTASADTRVDLQLTRAAASGVCPPIGFATLTTNLSSVTTLTDCGFVIEGLQTDWFAVSTYGNPAPSLQFSANTPTTGEVRVSAGGRPFRFRSADLYSSVTPIPHAITGTRSAVAQFTIEGTVPNTFGAFATVRNPQPDVLIDVLSIRITNPISGCCSNPVGVDNIHVAF